MLWTFNDYSIFFFPICMLCKRRNIERSSLIWPSLHHPWWFLLWSQYLSFLQKYSAGLNTSGWENIYTHLVHLTEENYRPCSWYEIRVAKPILGITDSFSNSVAWQCASRARVYFHRFQNHARILIFNWKENPTSFSFTSINHRAHWNSE